MIGDYCKKAIETLDADKLDIQRKNNECMILSSNLVNDVGVRLEGMLGPLNQPLLPQGFQFERIERRHGDDGVSGFIKVECCFPTFPQAEQATKFLILLNTKSQQFEIRSAAESSSVDSIIAFTDDFIEKLLVDHAIACLRRKLQAS